jgi:hypothetical protein
VDYSRVLEGMKKDYPRARDIPSAGFAAGPCLLKDTMQLAAFASDGFTLVRRPLHDGHGVRVFDNQSRGRAARLADVRGQVEFIKGDVRMSILNPIAHHAP